jgi:hypothetical protein
VFQTPKAMLRENTDTKEYNNTVVNAKQPRATYNYGNAKEKSYKTNIEKVCMFYISFLPAAEQVG